MVFIDVEKELKSKKPVRPTSIPLNLQPLGKFKIVLLTNLILKII